MNNLIIIGNGFDLAHKLETRYSDFITWYLNICIQKLNSNPEYEDNLIKLINRDPKYSFPKLETIKDLNNVCYNPIDKTFYNPFLKSLIEFNNLNNWVDIESFYYSQLISIYRKLERTNKDSHPDFDKEVCELNSGLKILKTLLIEYLSDIKIDKSRINKSITDHLHPFINTKNGKSLFLNFNYTNTLELYINKSAINYIHGSLDLKEDEIIFGYGDELDIYYEKIERINNNEFLKNIKSFGYFKSRNYQSFSTFLNDDTFNVYIMGHSCGMSDRILLNSIFEHENFRKIQIYYHKIDDLHNDYFEKTLEISRHFKPINKGKMRNSIVPFPDCKPLINI